jgi:hypothetical protein
MVSSEPFRHVPYEVTLLYITVDYFELLTVHHRNGMGHSLTTTPVDTHKEQPQKTRKEESFIEINVYQFG